MIKPKHHAPQTAAEHEADIARVRQLQAAAHPDHQPWAACGVTTGGACPVCGAVVAAVNAEPLDFELRDSVMVPRTVVHVMLPCGHSVIRDTTSGT
ncbi:hypothetical protein Ate01nite_16660 [Actinoplanes teichomyceticus]|nr:hypothetical protein Ate01nite_16660 [Actinoplanes teichomyceticus]